jgi:outer membrane protein with beta-barrel domain
MRRLILLTVLALGTTAAQADSGLFYLGAGVTYSSLTANNNGYIAYGTPDLRNNSWKAFAGVRPLNWLAVEADYIDLGSGNSASTFSNESTDTTHADSSAWAAYAIGFLPVTLPVVDFYGKVGVARWKLKSTLIQDFHNFFNTPPIPPLITPRSYSGTDFAWGVGVQAHIKMLGVRLEYEGFDVDNNTANVASLSVFLNL